MNDLVERERDRLAELCRQYDVQRLDLFGSAAIGRFRPDESDLDFLVRFNHPDEKGYAARYYRFAEALEALFRRRVDLLIDQPFSNPFFRESVEESRRIVYEARHPEAAV